MSSFNIKKDADRAMDVVLNGGIAIIPTFVGLSLIHI